MLLLCLSGVFLVSSIFSLPFHFLALIPYHHPLINVNNLTYVSYKMCTIFSS